MDRNTGLDCLRVAAMLAVLANHAFLFLVVGNGFAQWTGSSAANSLSAVFAIEWLFVLSGFLIGSMMIRSFEQPGPWAQRARDFWLRRWFRTLPNYYLFLLVNVALVAAGLEHGAPSWLFALFSQNLAWPEAKPLFFSESWSLALDEWFYLLMPLLIGLAMRGAGWRGRRAFVFAAAVLILGPMIARTLAAPPAHVFDWDERIRRVTVFHLDATGWGVLAAMLDRWAPGWWRAYARAKAAVGLLGLLGAVAAAHGLLRHGWTAVAGGRFNDLALITLPAVAAVLTLPWMTRWRAPESLAGRVLARLGDYAYSIYLCHVPLIVLVNHAAGRLGVMTAGNLPWLVAVWLALVIALSALVFHGFEYPITSLRARFTRPMRAGPFGQDDRAPPRARAG